MDFYEMKRDTSSVSWLFDEKLDGAEMGETELRRFC